MPGVPRNMTVFRNGTGELVLYSVVAMHEDGMRALEALGRPTVTVVPHRRHQMDAPLAELSRFGIDAYALPGNDHEDTVMDLPLEGGRALCVCESLTNISTTGLARLLFKVLGPPGGGFGVARAVRFREIPGRDALKAWLLAQAERADLRFLLFGHGAPLARDIPAALRRAAGQV